MRRLPVVVVPLVLALAGCGGSDGSSEPTPEPTASTSAASFWNPCGGIEVGPVQRALGAGLRADGGTDDVPRCALLPKQDGGAVIDVNYAPFDGTLDEAWEAMGAPDDGSVTEPDVPLADAARLVVDPGEQALGVTGFVQKGGVVMLVNALDPTPYRQERVVDAVRVVMEQVAAYAPQ